jgi:hypothetical protein
MADSIQALIRDTVQHLKDPLQTRQTLLATAEETVFFSLKKEKPMEKKQDPPKPTLSPVTPPNSTMKQILQKAIPGVKIVEQVPDDSEAKRIAESWKEKVNDAETVLLLCETDADTVEFSKGLAKAIDQHLAKIKILAADRLEKEKRWDVFLSKNSLRLIIATEGVQKLPELMRFYKQNNSQLFLDKTPFLVLSSSSIYKSIEHKAKLWKTLCQMLK